jgi:hypothetical protein
MTDEFSFLQQMQDGKQGEMRLLQNGVSMSQSVVDLEGVTHTIFGTAILELQKGDKVSSLILHTIY